MNKCIVVGFAAFATVLCASAQTMPGPHGNVKLNPKRAARIAQLGGFIQEPSTGNVIRVVNAQSRVGRAAIEVSANNFLRILRLPYVIDEGKVDGCPMAYAFEMLQKPKTGAVLLITDDQKTPSMLVAPESRWGIINVAALMADNPKQEVLDRRLQQELFRTAGHVLGAANSMMQPCLMRTVLCLNDLDRDESILPQPEPFQKMMLGGMQMGMLPARTTTYKRACEQGWAPAPTNDIQKAIWEEVKAANSVAPTKGMKIKYDPKTGR